MPNLDEFVGGGRVILGDCLDVLPTLAEGSVDAVANLLLKSITAYDTLLVKENHYEQSTTSRK